MIQTHLPPQQKAIELFNKFSNSCYGQSGTSEESYHAKIAAKTCIEEIIPLLKDDATEPHGQSYWRKVLTILQEL